MTGDQASERGAANDWIELKFYFYPSPGLDWDSPWGLLRSTLRNYLLSRPRPIGHVTVECVRHFADVQAPASHLEKKSNQAKNPNKSQRLFFTGMRQISRAEGIRLLLLKKAGFGLILHTFQGRMEHAEELDQELQERLLRQHGLNYLSLRLPAWCEERLVRYWREFQSYGDHCHYGLPNRPLWGEGAGCSAFAASFLEVIGLLDTEFLREWTQVVRVPKELVGRPWTERVVGFFDLFKKSKRMSWARAHVVNAGEASAGEASAGEGIVLSMPCDVAALAVPGGVIERDGYFEIFFWDPDRMFAWVEQRLQQPTPPAALTPSLGAAALNAAPLLDQSALSRVDESIMPGLVWDLRAQVWQVEAPIWKVQR